MFDLGRAPNKHLTFGFGPHFCLGAYLGRAEIHSLLEALRSQVGHIEAAGEARRTRSNLLSGFSRLPVVLTPA
jgi:cytochrome P450